MKKNVRSEGRKWKVPYKNARFIKPKWTLHITKVGGPEWFYENERSCGILDLVVCNEMDGHVSENPDRPSTLS